MNADERVELLRRLQISKNLVAISLDDVRAADDYLAREWGIVLAARDWITRIQQIATASLYERYRYLHERMRGYRAKGKLAPRDVLARWYDLLADPALVGWTHSQKRALILDALVLITHLVEALQIRGPILDVGCNVGYHAEWVSRLGARDVVGIDISKVAITTARSRSSAGRTTYVATDMLSFHPDSQFEFIYAVDCLAEAHDPDAIARLASWLVPGGVLLVISRDGISPEPGLEHGVHFADVTGGWVGMDPDPEFGGFSAAMAMAFVNGRSTGLRMDLATASKSAWPYFRPYANSAGLPLEEMTQAYHRAKCREGIVHWQSDNKPA